MVLFVHDAAGDIEPLSDIGGDGVRDPVSVPFKDLKGLFVPFRVRIAFQVFYVRVPEPVQFLILGAQEMRTHDSADKFSVAVEDKNPPAAVTSAHLRAREVNAAAYPPRHIRVGTKERAGFWPGFVDAPVGKPVRLVGVESHDILDIRILVSDQKLRIRDLLYEGVHLSEITAAFVTCATCAVISGISAVMTIPAVGGADYRDCTSLSLNGIECIRGKVNDDGSMEVTVEAAAVSPDRTSETIPKNYCTGDLLRDIAEGKEIEIAVNGKDRLSGLSRRHSVRNRMFRGLPIPRSRISYPRFCSSPPFPRASGISC